MDYPQLLLPDVGYKYIQCNLEDYFLLRVIRRADKSDLLDPVTKNVLVKHICSPRERINDLSVNLLSIYTEEHVPILFTKEGAKIFGQNCKPNAFLRIPEFQNDFEIEETNHFWCISIAKINNQLFEYTTDEGEFVTTCLVEHTPTYGNFWHFSIRWQINHNKLNEIEEDKMKKLAKKIAHNVRVIFSEYAIISIPDYEKLARNEYSDN
jgi:hypothetical protein